MRVFGSADMLIPQNISMEDWAVIACDQFTSQPDYWERVKKRTEGKPSTGDFIIAEVDLKRNVEERIASVHTAMKDYIKRDLFTEYKDCYIYVERTLQNGDIRRGILGIIDLEAYDYRPDSTSPIRASEQTVLGRIPVRVRVREKAPLEVSHVLMLADDDKMGLIAPLTAHKNDLPLLYDFELMENGGRIRGWLVKGAEAKAFDKRVSEYMIRETHRYEDLEGDPVLFAVGDGNHSIVTAKEVYEAEKKKHPEKDFTNDPLRYTLVELNNLYDDVQKIEPIYRIIKNTDPDRMLDQMKHICAKDGYPVTWCSGDREGTVYLDPKRGQLAISILQDFLDYYLSHEEGEIDYIHGEDVVRELAKEPGSIGFLMDPIDKKKLFPSLKADGPLTRKCFSMGHAREKRYYLEARRIR